MSKNIKILKVIINCSLHPRCCTICSRNREIYRDIEYLCKEFPALYVPSVGKMKIRNKGRKTLPTKIKCNNDAIQEKCFRKVIATRLVQYDYKTYSPIPFLPTKHMHPRLKDMAAGSPSSFQFFGKVQSREGGLKFWIFQMRFC